MKRLIISALCVVFCLSLCACGEKKEDKTETTAPTTVQATTAAATKPAETKAADSQPGDKNSSESSPYASAKEAAVAEAKKYLQSAACSYSGLVSQLEYMGYAPEDATYGADHCGADWNEQARIRANTLLQSTPYNFDNYVEALESEGFTHDQAVYGAQAVGDQQGGESKRQEALDCAVDFVKSRSYSYYALVDALLAEGYSSADAQYAADNCGANWNDQAVSAAQKYIAGDPELTKESLIDKLMADGFSYEQAVYGAESNGY